MHSSVWSDWLTGLDSNEDFQWPGPIRKEPQCWSVTLFATVSSVFTVCFWHALIPRWGSAPPRACLTQNPDLRWGLGIQAPRGTQTQMPAVVYSQVRLTAVHYPAITHTHAHTLGNIRASWCIMGQSGSTRSRSTGCEHLLWLVLTSLLNNTRFPTAYLKVIIMLSEKILKLQLDV